MALRGDIFQPVYWRKFHDKRNWLKSEEVSRTTNNKETLKDYVDQKMTIFVEKKPEVSLQPVEIEKKESPKKIIVHQKPKTAAPSQYKPEKTKKAQLIKKSSPIRLNSVKRVEPETPEPQEIDDFSFNKWERQEKICNELSDMYETELKRIYEIKARKTQMISKPAKIAKQKEECMRRTGGGFTQMNFFPKQPK